MPTLLKRHQLTELAHEHSKNEVLIDTQKRTCLHITVGKGATIIEFPFGNRFDIIDGRIIIHEKV